MYRSRKQIEKKLAQAKYLYKQISKFKNRIFVKGGLDEETDARPLLTYLSSFLANTRSVLQYAHREAKESGKLAEYQSCVTEKPIFRFFKDLRDSDIHEYTIGTLTTISAIAPMSSPNADSDTLTSGWIPFLVEDLSDLDSPRDSNEQVTTTITLSERIDVTDTLIRHLEAKGKHDLAEAAKRGEELYEQQEFEGETDLFELCERYLMELEDFVARGVEEGFIS
ncbi:MAG: hypothetical protein GTO18_15230 [Anaerolineales bacterium]|nr:hypothetical protein [Anaerolineales bacterium]